MWKLVAGNIVLQQEQINKGPGRVGDLDDFDDFDDFDLGLDDLLGPMRPCVPSLVCCVRCRWSMGRERNRLGAVPAFHFVVSRYVDSWAQVPIVVINDSWAAELSTIKRQDYEYGNMGVARIQCYGVSICPTRGSPGNRSPCRRRCSRT